MKTSNRIYISLVYFFLSILSRLTQSRKVYLKKIAMGAILISTMSAISCKAKKYTRTCYKVMIETEEQKENQ